jgi:hypothetical protein
MLFAAWKEKHVRIVRVKSPAPVFVTPPHGSAAGAAG